MYAVLFDRSSQQWVRLTHDGDAILTADRAQASVIFADQLDSYVRNYELEYLRPTLTKQECDEKGQPT